MNSKPKKKRAYDSTLRHQQEEETRAVLLKALVDDVIERGAAEVSLPKVAKRAKVSVPTVYRHFPTKALLLEAMGEEVERRLGLLAFPAQAKDLAAFIPVLFRNFDDNEGLMRARMKAGIAGKIRRSRQAERATQMEAALREPMRAFKPAEQRLAVGVLRTLASSFAWELMRDNWGMRAEESGRACAWAVRVLLKEIARNPKTFQEA